MKSRYRLMIYAVVVMIFMLGYTSIAYADLDTVKQATVSIKSVCVIGDTTHTSSGSGFIVSPDGFVITNAHVVISNDIAVNVKIGDRTHNVKGILCYYDDILDIAVLKVQLGGLTYLELGDDSTLKLGQRLFAVGSPLVFTDILTDGIFSAYNEELGMIQHTCELSHGNSGGPLVTEDGVVMGVNTIVVAFPGESRYYFAIPSGIVKAVLEGVKGQYTLNEIKLDCEKIIEQSEEGGGGGGTQPPSTTPPSTTMPAPSEGNTNVSITTAYINQVLDDYPKGWMNYSSSSLLYSFDLPDFYGYEFSDDDTYIATGMEFFASYKNMDDPNLGAVPIVLLYIGIPEIETFDEFEQFVMGQFEADGFVMEPTFKLDNVLTSQPELVFDVYWFDGEAGSNYESLSRLTYFIREDGNDAAYYCLDFTFNNRTGDALNDITLPLIVQALWTFTTGGGA